MQRKLSVTRPVSLLPWLLSIVCTGGAFAACGGGDGDPGSGSASTGSAAGANSGGAGGSGGDIGFGGNLNMNLLSIMPAQGTITITDKNTPVPFEFKAYVNGNPVPTGVSWSLDSYAAGSISTAGQFMTTGMVGGQVLVTAQYGANTATALLTIKVDVTEKVITDPQDPGVSPANQTALEGTPLPDPGAADVPPNASKILYPYDKTVMPRGLVAPLLQFTPGSIVPEDAKITMKSSVFSWQGYVHVKTPGNPQLYVPQDVWDAAMQSAGGETLTIDVVKAANGQAYGPAQTSIIVAPASLKGAVYYMTYEQPGNGLYSVRPGVKEPAKLLIAGCVVCHSVSANGTRLATGADDAAYAPFAGIYNVNENGDAAQLTTSPAGLGGDSRGLSFATFTPDGKYVMRSQNNFWGGVNQLAWRIDDNTAQLVPANVVGLGPSIAALLPMISHDNKRYVFTNGPGEPAQFGTPSRSISLMDLNVDETTDTLTFSNRKLLIDNGPNGPVTKFTTFMPDADHIVLQEGEGYQASFDMMLPTWGSNSSYTTSTGRLHMIRASTGEHIELSTLNAGIADIDRQRNYEPFALPVTAGGYFWVVFTSIREYGNTYSGPNVRKQLWVAAISPNHAMGEDPSHPPFYLPNQTETANERGFWALAPCRAVGAGCDTGDECCDGFCRPDDPKDPASPKVCKPQQGCSQTSEKCMSDGDCCDAGAGTTCIGGFCTPKTPT
jgi:hypothetical protein